MMRRFLNVIAVVLAAIAVDAAGWWSRVRHFPVQDALQFGLAYALAGIILYMGYRYEHLKLEREFRVLDELETAAG